MTDPAAQFTEMSSRIGKIDGTEFAGAVVIVPPGDGKPIAYVWADPAPNVAQFWSSLMARVEEGAADAKAIETAGQYGGRR